MCLRSFLSVRKYTMGRRLDKTQGFKRSLEDFFMFVLKKVIGQGKRHHWSNLKLVPWKTCCLFTMQNIFFHLCEKRGNYLLQLSLIYISLFIKARFCNTFSTNEERKSGRFSADLLFHHLVQAVFREEKCLFWLDSL